MSATQRRGYLNYDGNAQMADYADMLVAVWDRTSRGTRDMIGNMRRRKKQAHVLTWPTTGEPTGCPKCARNR